MKGRRCYSNNSLIINTRDVFINHLREKKLFTSEFYHILKHGGTSGKKISIHQ